MSMFGDTPKQDLYEALERHAETVGHKQAVQDLGDVLAVFVEYHCNIIAQE